MKTPTRRSQKSHKEQDKKLTLLFFALWILSVFVVKVFDLTLLQRLFSSQKSIPLKG